MEKEILSNYIVTKKKKKFTVSLVEGKNELKIKTVNSGSLETNTAKIKIYDYMREYEVISDLEEGKFATVNIIKLDPKKSKRIK